MLQRLFQTEESLQNHASDVLRLAKEGGYDGVEIDYEGLWKRGDSLLQSQYVHFLHVLVRMAEKEAIPVRVVLEPSVPFDAGFPRGASYVVMLYNLYGPHSGPGPKADDAFIQRTCRKWQLSRVLPPLRWQRAASYGVTAKRHDAYRRRSPAMAQSSRRHRNRTR